MAKRIVEEDKREIVQLALDGYATKEIMSKTGRSRPTVRKILKDNNITPVKKYPKNPPKLTEKRKVIVDMRKANCSYREIARELGVDSSYVLQVSRMFGLDGVRAKTNVWDDPNDFLQKYNSNIEYVSGWKSVDDYAVIRFKDCGHEYKCSMKTIRSHPEYSCKICAEHQRQETKRQKAKEHEQMMRQKEEQKKEQKKDRFWSQDFSQSGLKICPVCRNVFYSSRRVYCSDRCAKNRANQHHHDKRLKIIQDRTIDKDITLKGLSERFNGVCHICGETCDWNDYEIVDGVFIAKDSYPSIDHIIPLAEGGLHAWDNIKLAHRKCNWERWQNKNESSTTTNLISGLTPIDIVKCSSMI